MIDVPILVKDALRDGRQKKNYIINVLNNDGTTDFVIDNDTLVSESVDIDERMCSGDTIKFGLCEGSSIEFQYFNHPNITDRRIQANIEVYYISNSKDFIETESDTRHPYTVPDDGTYTFVSKNSVTAEIGVNKGSINYYYTLDSNNNYEVTLQLDAGDDFWVESLNKIVTVTAPEGFEETYIIPMGYFQVSKCSRQASTGIMKVTAYNKLQAKYLDEKANDDIVSIVENGVGGAQSTVNIGIILDELLGEYAIHRKEFAPSGAWSVNSHVIQTYLIPSMGQTYLHVVFCDYVFIPSDFSALNIYRATALDCKAIYNAAKALVPNGPEVSWNTILGYPYTTAQITEPLSHFFDGLVSSGEFDFYQEIYSGSGQYYTKGLIKFPDHKNDTKESTEWITNLIYMGVRVPVMYIVSTQASYTLSNEELATADTRAKAIVVDSGLCVYEEAAQSDLEKIRITLQEAQNLPDVTLRQLQSSVFEQLCQFGQLGRITDLFEGVELNYSRLYPATDLYPANNLYPDGAALSSERNMYSKLWGDEGNIQKWRYLIITYKGLDENNQEKEFTMQKTINADGTHDYNMSDNWIFKNLVWDAVDVENLADAMVSKMRSMTWFPFEMWCAGLPYIETGDEIEISINQQTYTSYILQRQLKGIQNLQDTFINGTLDIF